MKRIQWAWLLTLLFIITACGAPKFSQRKHLKGVFRNPSSHYKTSDTSTEKTTYKPSQQEVDTNEIPSVIPPESNDDYQTSQEVTLSEADSTSYSSQDDLKAEIRATLKTPESTEKPIERMEKAIPEISEETSTSPRGREVELFFIWMFVMAVVFFVGLLIILIYLILNAFELVGLWLLIVGCSMVGLALLYLLGVILWLIYW